MVASCSSQQLEHTSNAQVTKATVTNTPEVKQGNLEQAAKKLAELYNNKNCKEFFNAFPSAFQDFNQLYGYEDGKGGCVLFSKYPEHFSYFFDCSEVSDREKLNKVIRIGIDGKWEADTIGSFRDSTFKLIKDRPNETKKILDNLPDDKAASFWYFLFDGPHPNDKAVVGRVNLLSSSLGENSKQSKLLSEQYQKVRTSWENH